MPFAAVEGGRPVLNCMKPPARLTIPACIGCGAMRRDESCPAACSERRTELVNGADYDKLAAAAAACRDRGLRAVAEELAQAEPVHGGWKATYEGLQRPARSALRRFRPVPDGRDDDPFLPAQTVVVWRCPDCGGVDAPQPCIGVCIWRPAVWVDAACYEQQRSRAAACRQAEKSLTGLLRTLAFVTPRAGQWERSLRALQTQSRRILYPA
jgi:hypothetical protein